MLHYFYSILIYNRPKLKTTKISLYRKCTFIQWIYYSAIKNNEIMKFLGKWLELENILREITQTQKNTNGMYSMISGLAEKFRIPMIQPTNHM